MTSITFSTRERRDLLAAWLALGLAFALFLEREAAFALASALGPDTAGAFASVLLRSLLTVGVGFLLHELAHKVVAVRFGQEAAFRADYGMLGLAIAAGLAGFLFAAPGAVYHRGHITERENGIIAVAGPLTNVGLAVLFLPLAFLPGIVGAIGNLGVFVNVLLAAFNMIPFGPLDGRKVLRWSRAVFAAVFLPTAGVSVWLFLF